MNKLGNLWIYRAILVFVATCFSCQDRRVAKIGSSPLADKIIDQATVLLRSESPRHSIEYLDSAYQAFSQPTADDIWKKYNFKAEYYQNYEYSPVALRNMVDSMYSVLTEQNESQKDLRVQTIFRDADAFMTEKRYNDAFERYYQGLEFAKKNLDSCQYSTYTFHLAMVRFRQEEYLESAARFRNFLSENKVCTSGFKERVFLPYNALNGIALCFERTGQLDSALIYYRKSLSLLRSRQAEIPNDNTFYYERAVGVVYGNMGGLYGKLGRQSPAERFLKESIRINKRPGFEIPDALTAQAKLTELYLQAGRFSEANLVLEDVHSSIISMEATNKQVGEFWIPYYRLSWALADSLGQQGKAYQMLKRYQASQDSAFSAGVVNRKRDMDVAFQLKDQQYQLSLFSKNNKIKQQALMMTVGFTGMFIIILTVVWINLRRSSRQVKELKRLNQQVVDQNIQMHEALAALEQSQVENTHLLRVVAHDLRNPIGGIDSLISLLLEDELSSEEQKDVLETAKMASQNALGLVNDLLQANINKDQLPRSPVDLYKILRDCVDLLQSKAQHKEQHILLEASTLGTTINREKIWRVISNLLANAIKFSPPRSEIVVRLTEQEGMGRIAVEDRGIGIPESIKESIFSMTEEKGTEGTAGEESFGLGLAISKQIVDAHEGKIWFEDREGGGTVFFVALPILAPVS
jgi:signal transduction histidine kinase